MSGILYSFKRVAEVSSMTNDDRGQVFYILVM